MWNVAHVKIDVKWRPIVTKFSTLIERIWVGRGCMTAIFFRFLLTILWELLILVWEFYMLKSNIDVFLVTSFLCSLQFLLFHRIEYPKRCLLKKIYNSMAQFLWYDCTYKKQCTVPVTLTFDLWKYRPDTQTHTQTDRQTHRQTDRQTGWKQYLATRSGGEVIKKIWLKVWQSNIHWTKVQHSFQLIIGHVKIQQHRLMTYGKLIHDRERICSHTE